jgi:23S rRNA pseudouridine1911/1915/1917 synthase
VAGASVEVFFDDGPSEPFRLTEGHIIFRDKYLIAIAKPAGVETQPTPARYKGTLYEAVLTYLQNPFRPLDRPELGMVQRLDRDTSGVLVFSIHPRSHGALTRAFAERKAAKGYLALVKGSPEPAEGEIRSLLARNRGSNRVVTVKKGGKEAITRYRLLESFGGASLLQVEILTGRSHQIRAHMAEAGHPLIGDRLYGGPCLCRSESVLRQMLHSARLEFFHPVSGEPLALEAPLPDDFTMLLHRLRDSPGPV